MIPRPAWPRHRFHVNISWKHLSSVPVEVIIEDVRVVATPNSSNDLKELRELIKARIEKKIKEVASHNAKRLAGRAKAEDEDEEEEEEKGYIARLGRKIVDNLQVTVRNVHIRLEYLEHAPGGRPVALGLTLRELSLRSCGANGEAVFVDSARDATQAPQQLHKALRVDSLSCYLANPEKELQLSRLADRDGRCVGADAIPSIVVAPAQRVLAPTSAVVRVATGEAPAFPKAVALAEVEALEARLTREQYEDAVRLARRCAATRHAMPRVSPPVVRAGLLTSWGVARGPAGSRSRPRRGRRPRRHASASWATGRRSTSRPARCRGGGSRGAGSPTARSTCSCTARRRPGFARWFRCRPRTARATRMNRGGRRSGRRKSGRRRIARKGNMARRS